MIIEEIKNIDSSCEQLRKFGFVMGGALVIIALILYYNGNQNAYYISGLGGLFFILGYVVPLSLLPLHKIWMSIAIVMGFIMSRLIITIMFYVVLTPIGVVSRLFGKNFVVLKPTKNSDSYWEKREEEYKTEQSERLF